MLQTYAKATRKELSQIITIYQSILEFSFEEIWIDVVVKHAKEDVDNMLDDINAKLISVCEEYLKENRIWLDKYQLSMIVMDLYTKTITQLPQPFYVQAKEDKNKVKEYVKANKEYSKKLKEVKAKYKEMKKEVESTEYDIKSLEIKTTSQTFVPAVSTQSAITTLPSPTITVWDVKVDGKSACSISNKPKESKFKFKNGNVDSLSTEFTF